MFKYKKIEINSEWDWTIVLKSIIFMKDFKAIYIGFNRIWDWMTKDSDDWYDLTQEKFHKLVLRINCRVNSEHWLIRAVVMINICSCSNSVIKIESGTIRLHPIDMPKQDAFSICQSDFFFERFGADQIPFPSIFYCVLTIQISFIFEFDLFKRLVISNTPFALILIVQVTLSLLKTLSVLMPTSSLINLLLTLFLCISIL